MNEVRTTLVEPGDDRMISLAFSLRTTPGAYAVLLGAGVSVNSGVPSAWDVLTDLLSRLAELRGTPPLEDEDLLPWYESEFNEVPTYQSILERLAPTQYDRQAILKGYFEASVENGERRTTKPTDAHRCLAELMADGALKIVVTTNFDDLMEAALREISIEPVVIRGQEDLKGLGPLHTTKPLIVHLHGHYLSPEEMRNTGPELTSYSDEAEKFLDRLMSEYGLIIAGWSAKHDPKLGDAIRRSFRRIYVPYWIEPYEPTSEAKELMAHLDAEILKDGADDVLNRLRDYYAFLRDRETRRHPLTVPAVVSTSRRQLAGNTTATDLHDLIKRQTDELHEHSDLVLSHSGNVSENGAFTGMVARLEESSSVLAAAIATAAYWGDESTDGWWMEEIQTFAAHPDGSGLTAVLNLHNLVMIQLFYAAGLAALARGRTQTIKRLFSLEGHRTYQGRDMASQVLIPARVYASIPSGSKRLHDLMRPLFVDHLSIGAKTYEERWQQFEILRMIAASSANESNMTNYPSLADLTSSRDSYQTAEKEYNDWLNAAQRSGKEAFEGYSPVQELKTTYERNRGLRIQLIPTILPHVKMVRNEQHQYQSPVIGRMTREVTGAGVDHPLVRSNLLGAEAEFAPEMLRVVDEALNESLKYQNRVNPFANELWIDEF
ncbi:SIR2 family protein [Arthrobacter sp. ISL-85]|uniref:SIR2 family protein n=1 Tax=Arthrobacter sp. ISL-85 TaxID=2819115 RepID=UPI001BE52321|nr:SIR2 family protein [Arthrobacter sp. ISL-85]MBT2568137.1 SIR2 family protein [Arthrobacter sp. ISL-85]